MFALLAQRAHQPLCQHTQQGGIDEVRRHPQLHHAGDGAGRIVGVQGREHQVARQRSLDGHLGGLQVTDFAHHDDVGVLPHERAQAFGKIEVELRLHLGLIEAGLDHFDRVFHRAHVDLFGRYALQGGVQRGGLARACGPRHQDDAVRPLDQRLPALRIVLRKAQGVQVLDRVVGVKNAHDHLFAKRRGQGRQAHFHLFAPLVPRLDAAVLGAALFHHVDAAQQLDTRHHGVVHTHGHLVDRVQHAVDAETDHALVAARLQVDVAGTLVKGVLPEPVHHLDHALVVGVELLVALAQLHQLFKAVATRAAAGLLRRTHRLGERKKFGREAVNVLRVGHHPAHRAAGLALHLGHPVVDEGLGRGHHHFFAGYLHGQHLVALRIGSAHGVGHTAHIDLERVDAHIGQTRPPGQVLSQRLDVERLAIARPLHGHVGQAHQGMLRALGLRTAGHGALGFLVRDHLVITEPLHHAAPVHRPNVRSRFQPFRRHDGSIHCKNPFRALRA